MKIGMITDGLAAPSFHELFRTTNEFGVERRSSAPAVGREQRIWRSIACSTVRPCCVGR